MTTTGSHSWLLKICINRNFLWNPSKRLTDIALTSHSIHRRKSKNSFTFASTAFFYCLRLTPLPDFITMLTSMLSTKKDMGGPLGEAWKPAPPVDGKAHPQPCRNNAPAACQLARFWCYPETSHLP